MISISPLAAGLVLAGAASLGWAGALASVTLYLRRLSWA